MLNKKYAILGSAIVLVVVFSFMSNQKALQGRLSDDLAKETAIENTEVKEEKVVQSKSLKSLDREKCQDLKSMIMNSDFDQLDSNLVSDIEKCTSEFFMDFYRPNVLEKCGEILFDYQPTEMVESCISIQANLEEACRNIRIFYLQPGKEVSDSDPLKSMGSLCKSSFSQTWETPINEDLCSDLENADLTNANSHKKLQKQLCESAK